MGSSFTPRNRISLGEWLITLPSLLWLTIFFVIPAGIVVLLALRPADMQGGVGDGWTLDNFRLLWDVQYLRIFWRTLWQCAATTVICLLLAIPSAYVMARAKPFWRNLLLLLVIVPFWTNFLIRVFAWKSLLHPQGVVSRVLQSLGIVDDGGVLLYNSGAVLLVMVYTQLPFAILPLYAAAEKFDFSLVEAARDLGASGWKAFHQVFLKGVGRGVFAAALMVFVCTLGMYVVPDIVGGTESEMLGNKIAQRVQKDRNLPLASALSAVMLFGVALVLFGGWLVQRWSTRKEARATAAP